jgi:hypothetical protein
MVKDYKIDMCCFSTKHAALRRKSKDWLAQNQNNVSEWSDLLLCRFLSISLDKIKVNECTVGEPPLFFSSRDMSYE